MKTIIKIFFVLSFVIITSRCDKDQERLSLQLQNNKYVFQNNSPFKAYQFIDNTLISRMINFVNANNGTGFPVNYTTNYSSAIYSSSANNLTFTENSDYLSSLENGCRISDMGEGKFVYDNHERIIKIYGTDPEDSEQYLFFYNNDGRINEMEHIEIQSNGEALPVQITTYSYNNSGKVSTAIAKTYYYPDYPDIRYTMIYNSNGEVVEIDTDYNNTKIFYTYQNGNVVHEKQIRYLYGENYELNYERKYDHMNNFWRVLKISQPFLDLFAIMESRNNIIKEVLTNSYNDQDSAQYVYTYNLEGFPSSINGEPISYTNCN
ncbi:MAG: hypothetical protein NTW49_08315 [Bacteroidia bacterium]|nr:hypothetical protein [Bacteroidia bacterium]